MGAPVALFTYKRPEHTKTTLDALARNELATSTHLFVFSDGPKTEADAGAVESVRKLVLAQPGFASINLVERPTNMGLARSVITGVTELFETHEKVIVLEDDLVTARNFLVYMNEVLLHYRDDPYAFSVTGHTFPASYLRIPPDYPWDTYPGYRCSSWSWGTWRDRWQRIDWGMTYYPSFSQDPAKQEAFNRGGQDMASLLRLQYEGKIDSWAIRFCYAHYVNGMTCVYPTKSLVRNIGLDHSGTHSKPEPRFHHASLDEAWLPRKFCPANEIDARISASFRTVFAARVSRYQLVDRATRGLLYRLTRKAKRLSSRVSRYASSYRKDVDILVVNSFQRDGGAARAAYRMFLGIKGIRPNSHYLTLIKQDIRADVTGLYRCSFKGLLAEKLIRLDRLPLIQYPDRQRTTFSPSFWPNALRTPVGRFKPRLIHLHWVVASMTRIEELAHLSVPIIWTLHDAWPFTGGCHYTGQCEGFRKQCGTCPQLASTSANDLSHRLWTRKQRAFARANLTIVAPSRWLAQTARQSSLFSDRRIEVIPNGLDIDVFRPIDRQAARTYFGIEDASPVLLFGAQWLTDPRKGGDLLKDAIARIDFPCTLMTFGEGNLELSVNKNVTVRSLGTLQDDISLALMYSASDVFLCPSREDNLPNTVAEALACGTPCAAFNINGLPDMIEHGKTGWLAKPFDSSDLAAGISFLARHPQREKFRTEARDKTVREYSLTVTTDRYAKLYAEVLQC